MKKDQIIRIIRDAGKIPVERDVYYNPIRIHADHVIGKIPYLNSIAYHAHLDVPEYKILPVRPRRMGMLSEQGMIDAGLFSVMDFVRQSDRLEHDRLWPCLARPGEERHALLEGRVARSGRQTDRDHRRYRDVGAACCGCCWRSATASRRQFERLHGGVNDLTGLDAVLLIGDEALQANKYGPSRVRPRL